MKKSEIISRLEAIEKQLGMHKSKELDIGKWYHSKSVTGLFYLTEIKEKYRENKGFGIKNNNEWFDNRGGCTHFGKAYEIYNFTEATPQEVEEDLIKEAKRRYKIGDRLTKIYDDNSKGDRIFSNKISFQEHDSKLWIDNDSNTFYSSCIFNNGKWAEVIQEDKFAELKEAHKNGAVIECLQVNGEWFPIENPRWDNTSKYRIKPEEKPKVGDVCKFWDLIEKDYTIGNFKGVINIDGKDFYRRSNSHGYYHNFKPLTQQDVIDLLFPNHEA